MYLAGDCMHSPGTRSHRIETQCRSSSRFRCLYLTQAVIGPDGKNHLFGASATQVMGQSIRMERCDQPNLLDVGRAYSRALVAEGWKGPVNVQMKCTPTGDLFPLS